MLVRHFMTVDVLTFSPVQSCQEALKFLQSHRIRRAPIVKGGKLVGIVSERDLLRVLPGTPGQASTTAGSDGMDLPVENIMTSPVVTLGPNDPLEAAAGLMLKIQIGGVPVVSNEKLKGIITESDIFKAMHGIFSACSGDRIIFEEGPLEIEKKRDYVKLCVSHGCYLSIFLKYPKPGGGIMYFISFEGGETDALVEALWARSCQVLLVDRSCKGLT